MSEKNKKSIIGSIIAIVVLLLLGFFGFNNNDIYQTQAQSEQVDNLENVTVYSGNAVISKIPNDNSLRVYCLDVGQGDSILVVNNNQTMLIDASTNQMGEQVVKYLKDLGIEKIDYLVGTHPHEDHIGGIDNVIKNFNIGKFYMPKKTANSKSFEDVLDVASSKKLKINAPSIGDKFNVGNAKCEVMSIMNDAEDTNDCSIVIQMEFNGVKYLFTGDAGTTVENSRKWDQIDILKVGHHGSKTSSTKNFLNQTKPKVALISVGKGNDYGHPTEAALKRLTNIGAKIYRTDEDQTIMVLQEVK